MGGFGKGKRGGVRWLGWVFGGLCCWLGDVVWWGCGVW